MAHLSTTAVSISDLFTQFVTWATGVGTGQLGATMVDNISSTHVVIKLPGVANRPGVYVEIQKSLFTPCKTGMGGHDNIVFSLWRSWNAATHTGYGEVKQDDRLFVIPTGTNSSYLQMALFNHNKPLVTYPPDQVPPELYTGQPPGTSVNPALYGVSSGANWSGSSPGRSNSVWNGRGIYYVNQNSSSAGPAYQLRFWDSSQADLGVATYIANLGWQPARALAHSVDATNGKEYLWIMRGSGQTGGNTFYRYDPLLGALTPMADPPWGQTIDINGFAWTWDGGDRLYMTAKFATAGVAQQFAYYSISGNTWTSLAVTPVFTLNATYNYFNNHMLYVPASVSGETEDMIYWLAPKTDNTTTWYRYKVTSNVWETSGTNFPNLPHANSADPHFVWYDPTKGAKGTIMWAAPSTGGTSSFMPNALYPYDLASKTWGASIGTFSNLNNSLLTSDYAADSWASHLYWGALYLPNGVASINVQAVGTLDSFCVVATWVPPGGTASIQRMVYAGYAQSHMKQDKFTLAGGIAPGANVTITLNESVTGKLIAGDSVKLYDPTATVSLGYNAGTQSIGVGGEVVTIASITDATHIVVTSVAGIYPSGTVLSQAGSDAFVGNDTMRFGAIDGQSGYASEGCNDLYRASAAVTKSKTVPLDKRAVAGLCGIELFNPDTNCSTPGIAAQLNNLYTANPQANVNDSDSVNGSPYFVFDPYLKSKLSPDARLLEMGPTNG